MDILILFVLIIGGLLLFITEVFLIPGFGVAGIASAASLLYAIYFAFDTLGTQAGWITLGVVFLGIIAITTWFVRTKTVDRLAVKKSLDFRPDPLAGTGLKVGDTGIALTRLTLIGNAEINGHQLEVQSADGFIDERTPIQVSRISNGVVYVQRINH